MASNGSSEGFTPETVLTAMATMRGGDADKKKAAMEYLGKFQKSVLTIYEDELAPSIANVCSSKAHGLQPSQSSNRMPSQRPPYSQQQH